MPESTPVPQSGVPQTDEHTALSETDATRPPPSALPADLANHPRYEILQLLGRGGMGAVYKARHKAMERVVALKVINAALLDSGSAVERFRREVQAAAKLHHPNIVTAHDAELAGATHFLVMEFVEGTDLARYVYAKGPLPVAYACHFARQAALGLQHAHEHGMVHRDIKPANLMLTAGGVVKVMDFGLARLAQEGATSAGLTGENVVMGTADYIAPEQAQDARAADIRADIYSLGCTLFQLLNGRPPFRGNTVVEKITGHLLTAPPLAELPAAVPEGLRTVLAKMLAKDPAQRYSTPAEVAKALLPFIKKTSAGQAAPPGDPAGPAADDRTMAERPGVGQTVVPAGAKNDRKVGPTLRLRWWLAGSAAVLLAAAGLTAVWWRPGPKPVNPGGSIPAVQPAGALPAQFTNNLGMEFVLVPRGKFAMGGGGDKPGTTEVEMPHDFYLGKYEVTQEEWQKVLGNNPSYFSRGGAGKERVKDIPDKQLKRFPVEQVSWDDAQQFLKALNQQVRETGWVYRLPTEAEWEYACRGGPMADKSDSVYDFYLSAPLIRLPQDQANFNNVLRRTCKVGSYVPNRLGLYDMHGNVREWCLDESPPDPKGPARVSRGGHWEDGAAFCRASRRLGQVPAGRYHNLGLRVARVPIVENPPTFTNRLDMEFVRVPRGKFLMGGGGGKPGTTEEEIPQDFYLGKYEVTQEEWQKVMGKNPSYFSRDGAGKERVKDIPDDELKRFPVEQVSWDDVQQFVNELNQRSPENGWVYRLPTEAEWEYACRGGPPSSPADSSADFYFAEPTNSLLPGQANFQDGKNDSRRTCKVGSYLPNRLGLHDMHGNVHEWCLTTLDAKEAKVKGSLRAIRGGAFGSFPKECRATHRDGKPSGAPLNYLGLRVARVPTVPEAR